MLICIPKNTLYGTYFCQVVMISENCQPFHRIHCPHSPCLLIFVNLFQLCVKTFPLRLVPTCRDRLGFIHKTSKFTRVQCTFTSKIQKWVEKVVRLNWISMQSQWMHTLQFINWKNVLKPLSPNSVINIKFLLTCLATISISVIQCDNQWSYNWDNNISDWILHKIIFFYEKKNILHFSQIQLNHTYLSRSSISRYFEEYGWMLNMGANDSNPVLTYS